MAISLPAHALRSYFRYYIRPKLLGGEPHPIRMRKGMRKLMRFIPGTLGVRTHEEFLNGVRTVVFTPAGRKPVDAILQYNHGGGYVGGSPEEHAPFISRLARQTGMVIYAPDYRLAPEHPFPAALDDTVAVWQALLARHTDKRRFMGGDSAGGGLSAAVCLLCRSCQIPLPDKLYLCSPWMDLGLTGESYHRNSHRDVMGNAEVTEAAFARHYALDEPRTNPLLSPVHGDFSGFPASYVQVSDAEIFYSDSLTYISKARAAGVDVTQEIGHGLWHVWPMLAPVLPEANRSIRLASRWLMKA